MNLSDSQTGVFPPGRVSAARAVLTHVAAPVEGPTFDGHAASNPLEAGPHIEWRPYLGADVRAITALPQENDASLAATAGPPGSSATSRRG